MTSMDNMMNFLKLLDLKQSFTISTLISWPNRAARNSQRKLWHKCFLQRESIKCLKSHASQSFDDYFEKVTLLWKFSTRLFLHNLNSWSINHLSKIWWKASVHAAWHIENVLHQLLFVIRPKNKLFICKKSRLITNSERSVRLLEVAPTLHGYLCNALRLHNELK